MFITFEGIDGVGKTTQVNLLAEYYKNLGVEVVNTREPGGTSIAEELREIIMRGKLAPMSELMLFQAARVEHIEKVIKPALESGKTVICDRYLDSTVVYQGLNNISEEKIYKIHEITTNNFMPNITILLVGDPEVFQKRIKERNEESNRFDNFAIEKYLKMQEKFLKLAEMNKERIFVFDAANTVNVIHEQIVETLTSKFKK